MVGNDTTGEDPGFTVAGGANPPGAPTYDFAKFCEKLYEIEKILGRRGGRAPPPQMRHCTKVFCVCSVCKLILRFCINDPKENHEASI